METDIFTLSLEDKLYRTKYETDEGKSHITVDDQECRQCDDKTCLYVCPAEVYKPNPNDERLVTVSHVNCLECGTCSRACSHGAIDWQFPDGGMGVKYRFG